MSTVKPPITGTHPTRLRRSARVAMLAGALAIGAAAIVPTAIANAEWDLEAYDRCMRPGANFPADACCAISGGIWKTDDNGGHCVAPPADEATTRATNIGPLQGRLPGQSTPPTATTGVPAN